MESIILVFVGLLVVVTGIVTAKGHIEIIHSYNRKRITEETRKPYGKTVGIGCIVLGSGIIADGIISFFIEAFPPVITLVSLIVGLGFILYGQFKYNKGIF